MRHRRAAELVENLRFTPEDIDYLASLEAPAGGAMFKSAFLDYLRDFRAHVNIDAVPEGELVFPREPMVRVTGPALECQLLETALLNIVGFQTLVATKTARVVLAADGRPVAEFGLRRARVPMAAWPLRARATSPAAPLRPMCSPAAATVFPSLARMRTAG